MDEGLHKLKGEFGQFVDLRGQGSLAKKRGLFFPHLGRQGAAMTVSNQKTPKRKKSSDNDWMTAEILQKRLLNK